MEDRGGDRWGFQILQMRIWWFTVFTVERSIFLDAILFFWVVFRIPIAGWPILQHVPNVETSVDCDHLGCHPRVCNLPYKSRLQVILPFLLVQIAMYMLISCAKYLRQQTRQMGAWLWCTIPKNSGHQIDVVRFDFGGEMGQFYAHCRRSCTMPGYFGIRGRYFAELKADSCGFPWMAGTIGVHYTWDCFSLDMGILGHWAA